MTACGACAFSSCGGCWKNNFCHEKKQVLAKAFKEKEGDMFGVAMSGRGGEGNAAGWKPLLSASSVKFIFNFDSVERSRQAI